MYYGFIYNGFILWFSYAFKVCSKSVPEIWYIPPVIVVGAAIMHKMFAESFPTSVWVKKFNLQITIMFTHFSHYANPPKCIIDTADMRKTLDIFYIYFFQSMICQNQIKETLSSLSLWAILLQDTGTKWWLFVVPGMVFDFAKWFSRSERTLTISSWSTPENVMEGIFLRHRSNIDW